jgi:hypothetical protein
MNAISKRGLLSIGAVLILLLCVNLWLTPNNELRRSPTSFGVLPTGYKAAYDLLSELHFPIARSFLRPNQLPAHRTVWFVAPSFLNPAQPGAGDDARELLKWIRSGGTAVVFGERESEWKRLEISPEASEPDEGRAEVEMVHGDFASVARMLYIPELLYFAATPKDARVRLSFDGVPFALEKPIGKGRLIAIADDRFLLNSNLDQADASVLLVDLARALGAPTFDEHFHGLAAPVSIIWIIADSRAMLPILVALFAALLWMSAQRAWPRRILTEVREGPAPQVASFIESLGVLYSRASDPAAVFKAYRAGFLRGLRRQISMGAEVQEELLLERLARDLSLSKETRHWLIDAPAPRSNAELVVAVRAIESYRKRT